MRPLIIVGAGGHGRVILDAAEAMFDLIGWPIAGFVDDRTVGSINGFPVLGTNPEPFLSTHRFIVAIGNQHARRSISQSILAGDGELATVIHPTAWVSPNARIGKGVAIIGGAIVNANASVGDFCILNTGCSVDHDNELSDGVQVCPGARLAGNVTCGDDAFIGTGAVVIPGVSVGARAIVGAGSVVLRDIPADTTAVGLVRM